MKKLLSVLMSLFIAISSLFCTVFIGCGESKEAVEQFTVILDYQGATVSGDRQFTLDYGAVLPELPKNLEISGKKFCGWFTEKNCGGKQVADEYGNIPVVSVLNENNFDLSAEEKIIYLYAGFEVKMHTVELRSDDGLTLIKTLNVEEGKDFSEIGEGVYYNNKTVLKWSSKIGGAEYSGKILSDMTFYALSYGYTVIYNANGGGNVGSVIVNIGDSVTPPVINRTGYAFLGWYDTSGNLYNKAFTPNENKTLTAKWEANIYNITLNAQGGTIDSSSQAIEYGSEYTLSVPVRHGYLFVGWFTAAEGGEQITSRSGSGLSSWNKAQNIVLFAQWSKLEYEVSMNRQNCKQDNGYNPSMQDKDDRAGRHDNFDLVKLVIINAEKLNDGSYRLPKGYPLALSLKVLQNVASLPLNGNANTKALSDDDYSGSVAGTNISNKKIGYGAYYVCITYTDGTKYERNATNILSGKGNNDLVRIEISTDTGKTISNVSVVVVYEIITKGKGALGIWWNEHSNWRLTATLNFS